MSTVHHMDISENGDTLKSIQIIHFHRILPLLYHTSYYKLTIYTPFLHRGIPHLWKPPCHGASRDMDQEEHTKLWPLGGGMFTKVLTQAILVAVRVEPLSVDARLNPKRIKKLGVEIFLQAQ